MEKIEYIRYLGDKLFRIAFPNSYLSIELETNFNKNNTEIKWHLYICVMEDQETKPIIINVRIYMRLIKSPSFYQKSSELFIENTLPIKPFG